MQTYQWQKQVLLGRLDLIWLTADLLLISLIFGIPNLKNMTE